MLEEPILVQPQQSPERSMDGIVMGLTLIAHFRSIHLVQINHRNASPRAVAASISHQHEHRLDIYVLPWSSFDTDLRFRCKDARPTWSNVGGIVPDSHTISKYIIMARWIGLVFWFRLGVYVPIVPFEFNCRSKSLLFIVASYLEGPHLKSMNRGG